MRNKKTPILESRKRRADRRSRDDIKRDILKAISMNSTLKRTHVANICNINYTVAVDYTDEMMKIDGTIKRDDRGIFELTETGREEIIEKELGKAKVSKIIAIARGFAEHDMITFEQGHDRCSICGNNIKRGKGHSESCYWDRLRKLFDIVGKKQ